MRTFLTIFLAAAGLIAVEGQAFAGGSLCDATVGNLVANCGFETGDFTAWTLSGNDVPMSEGVLYAVEGTDPIDGIPPNSGSFQAFFADLVANATTLQQNIATKAGDTYKISWDLAQDTAAVAPYSNAFSASFGASSLVSLTAMPVQGYTAYSFSATATGASTGLDFVLGNDLGEYLLDDVTVVDTTSAATPEPATWVLMAFAGAFGGLVAGRRLRRAN
jgi:hypothetical protein